MKSFKVELQGALKVYPRGRKMKWSLDCGYVLLVSSDGRQLDIYSRRCEHLYSTTFSELIYSAKNLPSARNKSQFGCVDFELIKTSNSPSATRNIELVVIGNQGSLLHLVISDLPSSVSSPPPMVLVKSMIMLSQMVGSSKNELRTEVSTVLPRKRLLVISSLSLLQGSEIGRGSSTMAARTANILVLYCNDSEVDEWILVDNVALRRGEPIRQNADAGPLENNSSNVSVGNQLLSIASFGMLGGINRGEKNVEAKDPPQPQPVLQIVHSPDERLVV
jgi:hypothetical protein